MLTAKQYEGIGRFTIAFNEIDQVVEVYLPLVIKYARFTLPPAHRNPRTFHARAIAFRAALELVSAAEEVAAAYAGGILKILDRAEAIAATRNQYVHAAFIDFQTNMRMLQMRNGDAAPDEKQITDLAMESAWLARNFAEECEGLLRMYLDMNRPPDELALLTDAEDYDQVGPGWE